MNGADEMIYTMTIGKTYFKLRTLDVIAIELKLYFKYFNHPSEGWIAEFFSDPRLIIILPFQSVTQSKYTKKGLKQRQKSLMAGETHRPPSP